MIKNTPLIFVIKIWCAILIMGPNNDVDYDSTSMSSDYSMDTLDLEYSKQRINEEIINAGMLSNISPVNSSKETISIKSIIKQLYKSKVKNNKIVLSMKNINMMKTIKKMITNHADLFIYNTSKHTYINLVDVESDIPSNVVLYKGKYVFDLKLELKYFIWYFLNNYKWKISLLNKYLSSNNININSLRLVYKDARNYDNLLIHNIDLYDEGKYIYI